MSLTDVVGGLERAADALSQYVSCCDTPRCLREMEAAEGCSGWLSLTRQHLMGMADAYS